MYLSTGTAFATGQIWGTYACCGLHQVADTNGDGKTDYVYADGGNINVYVSTGSTFSAPAVWGTYSGSGTRQLGDFNGDRKEDYIQGNGNNIKVSTVNAPFPDLVTNITNPFGGTTAVTYKPLTDSTVYTKDTGAQAAVYPNVDLQHPLYVVSNLTASDGLGANYAYDYSYAGAKAHLLGRGGLGFRSMQEIDSSANKRTTTFYNQTFPYTSLPSNIETDRASDGVPFKDTIHTYWNENAYPSAPTVSFVAPKQVQIVEQEKTVSGFIIVILLSLLPDNPYLRHIEPAALGARSAKRDHWVYLRCERQPA
ncbi:MAG: VCBS repeat-containing protein [Deltaproteobacteria bacterium]|nr:VCBS repeat-containing protein [Deltaproteobacteria bacterium]